MRRLFLSLLLLPLLANSEQISLPDAAVGDIADPALINALKAESNNQDASINSLDARILTLESSPSSGGTNGIIDPHPISYSAI